MLKKNNTSTTDEDDENKSEPTDIPDIPDILDVEEEKKITEWMAAHPNVDKMMEAIRKKDHNKPRDLEATICFVFELEEQYSCNQFIMVPIESLPCAANELTDIIINGRDADYFGEWANVIAEEIINNKNCPFFKTNVLSIETLAEHHCIGLMFVLAW